MPRVSLADVRLGVRPVQLKTPKDTVVLVCAVELISVFGKQIELKKFWTSDQPVLSLKLTIPRSVAEKLIKFVHTHLEEGCPHPGYGYASDDLVRIFTDLPIDTSFGGIGTVMAGDIITDPRLHPFKHYIVVEQPSPRIVIKSHTRPPTHMIAISDTNGLSLGFNGPLFLCSPRALVDMFGTTLIEVTEISVRRPKF